MSAGNPETEVDVENLQSELLLLYQAFLLGASVVQVELDGLSMADKAFMEATKGVKAGLSMRIYEGCADHLWKSTVNFHETLITNTAWQLAFKLSMMEQRRFRQGMRILCQLRDEVETGSITFSYAQLVEGLSCVFDNVHILNLAKQGEEEVSLRSPCVDIGALHELFTLIHKTEVILGTEFTDQSLKSWVCHCIRRVTERFQVTISHWTLPRQIRVFMIFLICPFFEDKLAMSDLVRVYECLAMLPQGSIENFENWLAVIALETLKYMVGVARLLVTVKVLEYTQESDRLEPLLEQGAQYVKAGSRVLSILFRANEKRKLEIERAQLLPEYWVQKDFYQDLEPNTLKPLSNDFLETPEFYEDTINENPRLLEIDFIRGYSNGQWLFDLVSNPCILSTATKANLMALDSRQQRLLRRRHSFRTSFTLQWEPPTLRVRVRREQLVEDALNSLVAAQAKFDGRLLKLPLEVEFCDEEGIDQGGLAKEFFQLLTEQLFNPDYGMFHYVEESQNYWFVSDSIDGLVHFELIGIVLGLALFHHILLDIHFPNVLYKKLLSGSKDFPRVCGHQGSPPAPQTQGPLPFGSLMIGRPDSLGVLDIIRNFLAIPELRQAMVERQPPGTGLASDLSSAVNERPSIVEDTASTGQASENLERHDREDLPQSGSVEVYREVLGPPENSRREEVESNTTRPTQRRTPAPMNSQLYRIMNSDRRDLQGKSEFIEANSWSDKEAVSEMAHRLPPYVPSIDDLDDLYPSIAINLRRLLKSSEAEVPNFGLTFSVTANRYGNYEDVPLPRDDGSLYDADLEVTAMNRTEYVRAILRYFLETSIAKEFKGFYKGWHRCCGGPVVQKLTPSELKLLICGVPGHLDFEELEKGTRYRDGYTENSTVVRWLWKVLHGLSQEDKRRALFFITGSERTPVAGLRSLNLTISKAGGEMNRLPTAHTCFNHLLLPVYDSEEQLERFLLKALEYCHGFGLR